MKLPQILAIAAAGVAVVVVIAAIVLLSSGGDDDSTATVSDPSASADGATPTVADATLDPDEPTDEVEIEEPTPAPAVTGTLAVGTESPDDTSTVYIVVNRQGSEGRETNTHGRVIGMSGEKSYDELAAAAPADLDIECLVDYTQPPGTLLSPCAVEVETGDTISLSPGPEFTYTVRDGFASGSLEFAGWTGCEAGPDDVCTVKVEEDIALVANFRPLVSLEVEKRGYPGEVYVVPSSLPSGTRCAGNPRVTDEDDLNYPVSGCVLRYPAGTTVTLTAKEGLADPVTNLQPGDPGFPESLIPPGEMPHFLRFEGPCEAGTEANVCMVEMEGGKRYEVLALYEFYECPKSSPVQYPQSQHDGACGDSAAAGPITPSAESGGAGNRRQRVCDEPPSAPAGFTVPEHLRATVAVLSAISGELAQQALDYAATYDPQINPRVEWFLDPALELHVRAKPGQRCGEGTPRPR